MHRLSLIRDFARRDARKIPDDGRHPLAVLDDILGVGFHARRITFILKCFSQAQDAEQGVVQFVADACRENTQTSRLFRLHKLFLHAAFVCRVPKHEPDAIGFSRPAGHTKPFVPVQVAAQLQLRLPAACDSPVAGTSGSLILIGSCWLVPWPMTRRLPVCGDSTVPVAVAVVAKNPPATYRTAAPGDDRRRAQMLPEPSD